MMMRSVVSIAELYSSIFIFCRFLFGIHGLVKRVAPIRLEGHNRVMTLFRCRTWLLVPAFPLARRVTPAEARTVRAPWVPLPDDATLVTAPAVLTSLFADHTVHGIYLPDDTKWREYTAADGRTIWEFDGCLFP